MDKRSIGRSEFQPPSLLLRQIRYGRASILSVNWDEIFRWWSGWLFLYLQVVLLRDGSLVWNARNYTNPAVFRYWEGREFDGYDWAGKRQRDKSKIIAYIYFQIGENLHTLGWLCLFWSSSRYLDGNFWGWVQKQPKGNDSWLWRWDGTCIYPTCSLIQFHGGTTWGNKGDASGHWAGP